MAAAASPSKRPRSPEHAAGAYSVAPPAKLTHSPSTRDSSSFIAAATTSGVTPSSTGAANSMAAMMQQADYDSHPSGYPALSSSSSRVHQQPRSAGHPAGRIFSDSPASAHASQPPMPSNASSNYRIASHSGSTTSGFSGGSVGSSYDGNSVAGGSYMIYNDGDPGSAVPSSAGSAHGLGVHVQGPGYGSYSASSRSQHASPAHHHAPQPHPSSSGQTYYVQPYGYQASPATSHPAHFSSSTSSAVYHPTAAAQSQAYAGNAPFPLSQHHRRSIAAQSAGGSSYHSGASASPTNHRRSDDMMDGTFVSGAGLASSDHHPSSSAPQYSTPIIESMPSPAPHRIHTQGWSQPGASSVPGSAHTSYANVPSPGASYIDPSKPSASAGSPVHQGQHATTQNYQAIVDEIMNQTRKGTDYGLDLGDFEMLDTLGTGTFGRVLLVRLHPRASSVAGLSAGMPHYFAMKVLAKAEVVRLKQVEHISCERSILGAVDHTGIVNLFCTFQDSLNIYMLLEFVQGGELFSHLRRAVRFSGDVTRFYAANIILVLEYLHNRNLIYRDLKPENLLLDSTGYLKVTDFGFAKYVPDRTFTLCGTPEYLAPEIINSAGHGKAADWWAFGVLLFEMLCGYPPFFDESPWGIYEKILAGNFAFPPHVHPVARDLIRRLLSSDRSKRLGNLRGGASDVKNHQWFEGVDWVAVERRSIPAPIVPRIKSTSDSQNFERYPAIPLETLPGLAKAKGMVVNEEPDPYEHMFVNF